MAERETEKKEARLSARDDNILRRTTMRGEENERRCEVNGRAENGSGGIELFDK
jgi:hypothetical protein